jgi:phage shock protein PspC (stress-responsive transcriptional regulator)
MEKKLERNAHNKMLGGIASGLADYLDIDVTIIRICFILLAVFGAGLIIYIILWIAIPEKPFLESFPNFNPDYINPQPSFSDKNFAAPIIQKEKKDNKGKTIAGAVLILIGAFFLLNEFHVLPHWFSIFKLWPVIIIALGLLILFKSGKKKHVNVPPTFQNDISTSQEDNNHDKQPLA